jgi:hypothetical protein
MGLQLHQTSHAKPTQLLHMQAVPSCAVPAALLLQARLLLPLMLPLLHLGGKHSYCCHQCCTCCALPASATAGRSCCLLPFAAARGC